MSDQNNQSKVRVKNLEERKAMKQQATKFDGISINPSPKRKALGTAATDLYSSPGGISEKINRQFNTPGTSQDFSSKFKNATNEKTTTKLSWFDEKTAKGNFCRRNLQNTSSSTNQIANNTVPKNPYAQELISYYNESNIIRANPAQIGVKFTPPIINPNVPKKDIFTDTAGTWDTTTTLQTPDQNKSLTPGSESASPIPGPKVAISENGHNSIGNMNSDSDTLSEPEAETGSYDSKSTKVSINITKNSSDPINRVTFHTDFLKRPQSKIEKDKFEINRQKFEREIIESRPQNHSSVYIIQQQTTREEDKYPEHKYLENDLTTNLPELNSSDEALLKEFFS